jgi:hypothetical protein
MLEHLFNTKTGFASASNAYLAAETGVMLTKVRDAMAALENGGAIIRVVSVRPGRQ